MKTIVFDSSIVTNFRAYKHENVYETYMKV